MKTTETRFRARTLLHQAEDFAATSVAGVIDGLHEDPVHPNRLYRSYAQLTLGLEVHFLFPNLSRVHQRLLSQLLEARNTLVVRKRACTGRRRTGLPPRAASASRIGAWERRFGQLRNRAEALQHSQKLTPVQREVLRSMLRSAN